MGARITRQLKRSSMMTQTANPKRSKLEAGSACRLAVSAAWRGGGWGRRARGCHGHGPQTKIIFYFLQNTNWFAAVIAKPACIN